MALNKKKEIFQINTTRSVESYGTDNNIINSHVSDCCSSEDQGTQFEIHKPEIQHIHKSLVLRTHHTVRKFLYSALTLYKICNYFSKNCIYNLYYKMKHITEKIIRAIIKIIIIKSICTKRDIFNRNVYFL